MILLLNTNTFYIDKVNPLTPLTFLRWTSECWRLKLEVKEKARQKNRRWLTVGILPPLFLPWLESAQFKGGRNWNWQTAALAWSQQPTLQQQNKRCLRGGREREKRERGRRAEVFSMLRKHQDRLILFMHNACQRGVWSHWRPVINCVTLRKHTRINRPHMHIQSMAKLLQKNRRLCAKGEKKKNCNHGKLGTDRDYSSRRMLTWV